MKTSVFQVYWRVLINLVASGGNYMNSSELIEQDRQLVRAVCIMAGDVFSAVWDNHEDSVYDDV